MGSECVCGYIGPCNGTNIYPYKSVFTKANRDYDRTVLDKAWKTDSTDASGSNNGVWPPRAGRIVPFQISLISRVAQ